MALYAAFKADESKTFLVTNAGAGIVQVGTLDGVGAVQYRIRNLSATPQYIAWATTQGALPGVVAGPAAGAPVQGVIGMIGGSVEVYTLPANAWFKADNATGFEVQCGEGS